jgi:ornithine carbamoyltransferase
MNTKLRGKDMISLKDYNKEEIETILDIGFKLKAKLALGEPHQILAGKSLGMIFADDSLRTRISFETAMTQLGGHAQYFTPEKMHLIHSKEPWEDTAQVMSRFLDGIMIRLSRVPPEIKDLSNYGAAQAIVELIARNASCPVINGYTDKEHPCQTIADLMTIIDKFGSDFRKKKIAHVWGYSVGRWTPAAVNSLVIAAATLGMTVTFAHPVGFHFDPEYEKEAKVLAHRSGAAIEVIDNMHDAIKDADIVYVEPQSAIGKTLEESERMRSHFKDWIITEESFKVAAQGALFMHAMPIRRGEEVVAEVADGPMSIIYDQAENRLHAQKAIMALIM